jgi:hypothetical protein
MTLAGGRCEYRHADGRLCVHHIKSGAVIPDAWTPTGLPVFFVRQRGDQLVRLPREISTAAPGLVLDGPDAGGGEEANRT